MIETITGIILLLYGAKALWKSVINFRLLGLLFSLVVLFLGYYFVTHGEKHSLFEGVISFLDVLKGIAETIYNFVITL